MKRALETAEIMIPGITAGSEEINGDLTGIKFLTIDELHETDFGIFEGRTYEELNADPDTRDAYQAWIDSGGTMKIPDGESLEESQARSLEGFHKAVQKARTAGANQLIIVAHGGTVMSVMQSIFGGNYYDYYTGNGDGYTFELEVDDAGDITAAGTYDRFCGRIRA
jgi:alpha-ribazole phosphatase